LPDISLAAIIDISTPRCHAFFAAIDYTPILHKIISRRFADAITPPHEFSLPGCQLMPP